MHPMPPTEEEELDPRSEVLKDIKDWALMSEADGMRARYGKPPRPADPGLDVANPMEPRDPMDPLQPEEGLGGGMAGEDEPELPGAIPGVEPTEDGEAPAPSGDEEPDEEELLAALAAMGG